MSAVAVATWEALRDRIIADLGSGVNVASYQMAGRSFGYRDLDQQVRLLKFVNQQIEATSSTGQVGFFQLARVSDI